MCVAPVSPSKSQLLRGQAALKTAEDDLCCFGKWKPGTIAYPFRDLQDMRKCTNQLHATNSEEFVAAGTEGSLPFPERRH